MTARIPFAHCALAALCALSLLATLPALASAKTVRAELRVLTPTRVLDPGTTYLVGAHRVSTDPGADCNFGGAGGSGAAIDFAQPTALGLLDAGAEANPDLRPLSVTDEFGFGLAICGIGAVDDQEGTFWYLKRNHTELTVGADQEPIRNGDEILVYLAPDNFPAANPAELELRAPARAQAQSQFEVSVIEHACVADSTTFEITCESTPADGVQIKGVRGGVTTEADGAATVEATGAGTLDLTAVRGADIPSKTLGVCVAEELESCPASRGERILGRGVADRIRGTKGADVIRARGGADRIDIRSGGADRVDCGPGTDRVLLKRSDVDDRLARDCERTRRR